MSQQTKTRFSIDLDDLEQQLRQAATVQPKAPQSDPLLELARIVGQDDPFKAILMDRKPAPEPVAESDYAPVQSADRFAAPPTPARAEPDLDALFRSLEAETVAAAEAVSRAFPAPEPETDPSVATRDRANPVAEQAFDELSAALERELVAAAPAVDRDPLFDLDEQLRGKLRQTISPSQRRYPEPTVSEPQVDAGSAGEVAFNPQSDAGGIQQTSTNYTDDAALRAVRDLDQAVRNARAEADEPQPGVARYPMPPIEPAEDMRSLEPRQPRKGLVIAGALLGVAVLGVGGVIGMRGFGSGPRPADGQPPIVRAEPGPTRVAPQNPGGVEIPNQNKQIYERQPETRSAETRVVNREEQPIDVQATTRVTPRVIPLAPAIEPSATQAAGTSPAATPPSSAAPPSSAPPPSTLGEPRRVRTVAVRPDGTIAPDPPAATPAPSAPAVSTATPPRSSATTTPPAASVPPPSQTAVARAPVPAATTAERVQPPAPPLRPATAPTPLAPRQQTAVAATDDAPATRPPGGGNFMIQLGAPGSEAEARASFASLQRRYAEQLSSETPTIRRAEVGGRTVYRLRVGPFTREQAAEKCESIRSAGGQCFLASN